MQSKINLELKYFCTDFVGIRKELKRLGAKKIATKKQKDYFFALPLVAGSSARFKIRVENTGQTAIYYKRPHFHSSKGAVAVVELYSVRDKGLLSFLQKTLGVLAVVEKTREVWKIRDTVFHLDTVKGVGKIFEIELQKFGKLTNKDKKLFGHYKSRIMPYLGKIIKGSNLDLVKK